MFENINFGLSKCDISDIVSEGNRYLFHIFLIHVITHLIEGNVEISVKHLVRTLLISALAILTYNVFIKKIADEKLKKIRNECEKE
jgi:hypothetical protein